MVKRFQKLDSKIDPFPPIACFALKSNFLSFEIVHQDDPVTANEILDLITSILDEVDDLSQTGETFGQEISRFQQILLGILLKFEAYPQLDLKTCLYICYQLAFSAGRFDLLLSLLQVALSTAVGKCRISETTLPNFIQNYFLNMNSDLNFANSDNFGETLTVTDCIQVGEKINNMVFHNGFIFLNTGVKIMKIGTGCCGTKQGIIYATTSEFSTLKKSWLTVCQNSIYLRIEGDKSLFRVIDAENLVVTTSIFFWFYQPN